MWSSQKRFYAGTKFAISPPPSLSSWTDWSILVAVFYLVVMGPWAQSLSEVNATHTILWYCIPARCGVLHQARETEINSACETVCVWQYYYCEYNNREERREQFAFRLLKRNKMVGDLEDVMEWHHTKTCNCFLMFLPWRNKHINNM